MRRRPWFIVILAALHVFTPIVNLTIHYMILGITPFEFLEGLRGTGFLEIYRFYLLMPVAGVAIYAMKRWSYPVFFGSWIWCMAGNYLSLRETLASRGQATYLPPGREAASIVLNLALISYFLLPRVRAAYFRPNARWWEPKPRYLLNGVSAVVRWDEQLCSGALENLSVTGLKWRPGSPGFSALSVGDCVQITFEVFGGKYQVNGQVIRVDSDGALGVQLLHSARSRTEFKVLTRQLRSSQFHLQSPLASLSQELQDFVAWVKSLKDGPESLLPRLTEMAAEKNGKDGKA